MSALALGGNSRDKLQEYIARAERLGLEIGERKADLKEVYAEAKAEGFDVKILKHLVKFRVEGVRGAVISRREAQDLLDTYLAALGWVGPNGEILATAEAEGSAQ